ncbi:hypothetical protein BGP_3534 [Beggiatoa sp. PS]|nr:hypothetical protein BGP_3534 [Beggiatoa sp. PS]
MSGTGVKYQGTGAGTDIRGTNQTQKFSDSTDSVDNKINVLRVGWAFFFATIILKVNLMVGNKKTLPAPYI